MYQATLHLGFSHLQSLLHHRLSTDTGQSPRPAPAPLELPSDDSPLSQFATHYQSTYAELVAISLALVPHTQPFLIDSIVNEYLPEGGNYPAIGGAKGKNHRGFLPTGETLMYLLAGNDLPKRFLLQQMFDGEHYFAKLGLLRLEEVKNAEPVLSGRLLLDSDYIDLFTTGRSRIPTLSGSFPAQHLSTALDWEDLVLNSHTNSQIKELQHWIQHNDTLLYDWGLHKKIKPGFRALFYGPPGTGKTLTATLLGKYTGREVFRVDLSMVVSKYIGETEKNLSTLFDKARNKNWILFFDEADSLFSKRTGVRDAHDKYANQEVSYLLQRIEGFPGLIILATNFKTNLDEAFTRRFNSIIGFPTPRAEERLLLWQKSIPSQLNLSGNVDLTLIAQQFDLTGANIINIVQVMSLEALSENRNSLQPHHFKRVIQRELAKEGKTIKSARG